MAKSVRGNLIWTIRKELKIFADSSVSIRYWAEENIGMPKCKGVETKLPGQAK
jgi:hypothetical protein